MSEELFKYLRPARLEEPSSKQYKHWKKTFDNFLTKTKTTDDSDKLLLLTNFIHPDIYDHVSDAPTFAKAIEILDNLYIMPINVTFNRHVLRSSKQKDGESIEDFFQRLKTLSKDCEFTAVTAEQYQAESIRDAFIGGLSSSDIRQRLLEERTLTLAQAFEKARSLDSAQKSSAHYLSGAPYTAAIYGQKQTSDQNSPSCSYDPEDSYHQQESLAAFQPGEDWFYCGEELHA